MKVSVGSELRDWHDRMSRPREAMCYVCALILAVLPLSGCNTIGAVTGTVAAVATGTATSSPAVGVSVGIGVKAATDEASKVVSRKRQQAEQDAIAATVAPMKAGEARPWEVKHTIPVGNEHGEVRVVRIINTPLAVCKELLFSVEGKNAAPSWFTTSACQQGDKWKWAAAEPAVERWGNLQ